MSLSSPGVERANHVKIETMLAAYAQASVKAAQAWEWVDEAKFSGVSGDRFHRNVAYAWRKTDQALRFKRRILARWAESDHAITAVHKLATFHSSAWQDKPDDYWLSRLREEVDELAESLEYRHADPPEWELLQIASIAVNWLKKRGKSWPVWSIIARHSEKKQ